jgi:hypothetical protein
MGNKDAKSQNGKKTNQFAVFGEQAKTNGIFCSVLKSTEQMRHESALAGNRLTREDNTMQLLPSNLQKAHRSKSKGLCGIAVLCCLFFAYAIPAQGTESSSGAFTVIDATGAGTSTYQGTVATAIDTAGDVAGVYLDANKKEHAFVRSASGAITTFDATTSVSGTTSSASLLTIPIGFDTAGDLVGVYEDANNAAHGFLRSAKGTITTIDVTDAATGKRAAGTVPVCINASGEIAGLYANDTDEDGAMHGFVRSASGTITTFDAADAGSIQLRGTYPVSINDAGDVAGTYLDAGAVMHGFVRSANGTITTIDASGAGTNLSLVGSDLEGGTAIYGIDAAGDVTGDYLDAKGVAHGFVRSASGTITAIDASGAGAKQFQGTYPLRIDAAGDVVGVYLNSNYIAYGFVRSANGVMAYFSGPGSSPSASLRQGVSGTHAHHASRFNNFSDLHVRPNKSSNFFLRVQKFMSKYSVMGKENSFLNGDGGKYYGTAGLSINATGEVTGVYTDGDSVAHGFRRDASGAFTSIDAPNAGTGVYEGTGGLAINAAGTVVGGYVDSNSVIHGFLFTPAAQSKTTTTLTAEQGGILAGKTATFDVTVSSASGTPPDGEAVWFMNGATQLGMETLTRGTTTLTTSALPVGTNTITAVYGGDLNYSGSTSNAINQVVATTANPAPVIGSLSPAFTQAGNAAFTLTVNGSGFTANSTIYWNTTALATTYVSASQLTAPVTAAEIANTGTSAITVQTPTPGGGTSKASDFEIDSAGAPTATAPVFAAPTATVAAGASASFTANLPTAVTGVVSAQCLNLPTGATCSYSSGILTITTSTATPAGTYLVTAVFTETAASTAAAGLWLPILLLPLLFLRRKMTAKGAWITACMALVLMAATAFSTGCGGGSKSSSGAQPQPTQVVRSGTVSLTIQ